jgi:hypothetical protein
MQVYFYLCRIGIVGITRFTKTYLRLIVYNLTVISKIPDFQAAPLCGTLVNQTTT